MLKFMHFLIYLVLQSDLINRGLFIIVTRVCFYSSISEGVVSIDALTAKASDVIFTVSTTDSDSTQLTYALSCTPTGCPFDILNSK